MSQPKVLQVFYFDPEAKEPAWDMRRPSSAGSYAPNFKSFSILAASLGVPSGDGSSLTAAAEAHAAALTASVSTGSLPAFIALSEVTQEANEAIRALPWIRKAYATTELITANAVTTTARTGGGGASSATSNTVEHGCIVFWLHAVPVLSTESLTRCFREPRPCLAINSRQFCGAPMSFVVAHFDPTNVDRKVGQLRDVVIRTSPSDGSSSLFFVGNMNDCVDDISEENAKAIAAQRSAFGFEGSGDAEVLWTKSSKVVFVSSSSSSADADEAELAAAKKVFKAFHVLNYRMDTPAKTAPPISTAKPATTGATTTTAAAPPSTSTTTTTTTEKTATTTGTSQQPQTATAVFPSTPTLGSSSLPQPRTLSAQQQQNQQIQQQHLQEQQLGAAAVTSPSSTTTAAATSGKQQQQQQQRQFSTKHGMNIRVRDGTNEVLYDISPKFHRLEEAVKALNNGSFPWTSDFAICQGRLLGALHVTSVDLPAFRQWMASHEPPITPQQRSEWTGRNTPGTTPGVKGGGLTPPSDVTALPPPASATVAAAAAAAAPPLLNFAAASQGGQQSNSNLNFGPATSAGSAPQVVPGRRRYWNQSRATMLYQVTPKEMLFDITPIIGVGAKTLQTAIERLNGGTDHNHHHHHHKSRGGGAGAEGQEPDALSNYQYDYALLFSSERQGYWLLSVVDVPCDIGACRAAATQAMMKQHHQSGGHHGRSSRR